MKIYLIRHGKTEANVRSLYCGSTDVTLSDEGRQELKAICHDIKNVRFLTSGMNRANETLRLLFGDVPYEVDPRFREVDFGEFEMFTYEQLKHRADVQTWLAGDNENNVPPGGESGNQMKKRAMEAFSEIREDTCVVAHGGVIAGLMGMLFPEEGKNRYQWQPANGHGYCITEHGYTIM
jgi:alpha-ribazole phosphatase